MENAVHPDRYVARLFGDAVDKHAIDEGLKYVNNDACYPTLVISVRVLVSRISVQVIHSVMRTTPSCWSR